MSYPGQQVIAHIDRAEHDAELQWWAGYADCLTPAERKRLGAGNYAALKRPLEPAFKEGDWIEVRPKLHVHVDRVVLNRGKWQVWIDNVRDYRTHRLHMRHFREDPEIVMTLDVRLGANPPEPERMDPQYQKQLGLEARVRHAVHRGRQISADA